MAVPSSPVESIKANWVHVDRTPPHVDEKAFRAIDDRLHKATSPQARGKKPKIDRIYI